MDASSIAVSDPHVLQNLKQCPRLTPAQQATLNTLLASGRTMLGWVEASRLEMKQEAAWSLSPGGR